MRLSETSEPCRRRCRRRTRRNAESPRLVRSRGAERALRETEDLRRRRRDHGEIAVAGDFGGILLGAAWTSWADLVRGAKQEGARRGDRAGKLFGAERLRR